MKKILVSDYDMTLKYRNKELSCEELYNIEKIKEFMDLGNIFMISTTRQYTSILESLKEYNIPYNYLSCLNSNLLFDYNGNILSRNDLDSNEKRVIIEELKDSYYYNPIDYTGYTDEINPIAYSILLKKEGIITLDELPHIIRNKFGYDYYGRSGYIFSSKRKKDYGVRIISNIENIQLENIFTVGDEVDDIPMISKYNGYTLPWGNGTKKYALDIIDSVGDLIDKIENGKGLVRTCHKN